MELSYLSPTEVFDLGPEFAIPREGKALVPAETVAITEQEPVVETDDTGLSVGTLTAIIFAVIVIIGFLALHRKKTNN